MAWPTSTDIATRLARTFTTAETDQCDLILEQAIACVALAAGKDDAWSAALTPIPAALAGIVVEAAARAVAGSIGVRSESEQLGAYQHNVSYQDGAVGTVALTDHEERQVRRIVFGSNAGSAKAGSILDDIYELGS